MSSCSERVALKCDLHETTAETNGVSGTILRLDQMTVSKLRQLRSRRAPHIPDGLHTSLGGRWEDAAGLLPPPPVVHAIQGGLGRRNAASCQVRAALFQVYSVFWGASKRQTGTLILDWRAFTPHRVCVCLNSFQRPNNMLIYANVLIHPSTLVFRALL